MKIECSIDKIKRALMIVERIVGKNLTLPVLESILFIAKDKNLILRATNLSIGIETKIATRIDKEGIVAIKGNTLSSLFSNLKEDSTVFIEMVNDNLLIKTKTNTTTLKSVSHEDFPTIPIVSGESFIIPSKKFIDGLKSVYYSASVSEIKPEIGSVYFYSEENSLVFVSTDSFRLAEKRIKIKENLSFGGVLLPFKNVVEIIKVFEEINDDLKITLQKNQISISTNEIYLTSRIVDGVFPDYKQIIPKEATTEVVVLKQDFISSLKITNIFSDKYNQVTFLINPSKKSFEINSKNIDIGENKTMISAAISGEDVSANFNYKYTMDCLQSISSDSLSLQLNGSNKAMIIKGVGDGTFRYLIMPMNR
jgi:DNA polymerase III subunit beta